MFVSRSLSLLLVHPHQLCPFHALLLLFIFLFHCPVSFFSLPLFLCLSLYSSFLSDKLDEILAAAQQTISTNEAPGTRGQGPKRDRGRSFYGNEVCEEFTVTKVAGE